MIFVDSHVHLEDHRYDNDREDVLKRAQENNVGIIATVCCLTKTGDADFTVNLLEREGIYGIIGIHPHDASFYNEELAGYLRKVLQHPKIIAIGEIGLDYFYKHSPVQTQQDVFTQQIALAKELKKPIVVHSRDAASDTLEILKWNYKESEMAGVNGIMHCFSGDLDMAIQCISYKFLISFSGVITFENAGKLREIVKIIPLESMLSETDAPYLSPVPFRGKRNEPAYVVKVTNKIAEIKQMPVKEVAEKLYNNFNLLVE
ncbi:MAG: hypothetical protein A2Y62_00550 [Candidatus Fischerbacteria bacterium RBG_13_37_8]|uniref:Hydrolase TatD n=1 Tax=Candidatus Fischerbacteria bacterium RBG_13_37_8 TaxID=1817863 RepID=A0A1F5VMJ5_9BACT|nr:MAG: hypothetical protein A2Y62_00550 [Candidatus Fischerbacteria bacterium RBG_13_37_8]